MTAQRASEILAAVAETSLKFLRGEDVSATERVGLSVLLDNFPDIVRAYAEAEGQNRKWQQAAIDALDLPPKPDPELTPVVECASTEAAEE